MTGPTDPEGRPLTRTEIDTLVREILREERGSVWPAPNERVPRLERRQRRGHEPTSRRAAALLVALLWVAAITVALHGRTDSAAPAQPPDLAITGPSAPHTYPDGQHAFIDHRPHDASLPIGWDPCRSISVQLNPATAPPGTVSVLKETLRTIGRASGLELRYAGSTDDDEDAGFTHDGISVSLHPFNGEVPEGLPTNTVGYAKSYPTWAAGPTELSYYLSGAVTLDTTFFTHASHHDRSVILSHELGHALGLAHAKGPEIMHSGNYANLAWGHGDLTGLAELGRLPCRPQESGQ